MATQEVTVLPDSLFLSTDRSGPIPLYFQIATRIESAIKSGTLPAGARLENEIALAERLGLSRPTIRRAIQELVDKGLLVRRRGIGTQVLHGQITRSVALTSLYEDLERTQQRPSQTVLAHEIVEADAIVASELGLDVGTPVLKVRRVRFADDVPLALLENYVPDPYTDLALEQIQQHGLYQLLRARGVSISVARQKMGARRATSEESRLLEVDRHGPIITMARTAYDNAGRAIEYGIHAYRPDLYSFEITLVGKG